MLNTMRESFKGSPWLKIVLIIVALSMTLYLAAFFSPGGGPVEDQWVAKINDSTITLAEVREEYVRLENQYRQLLGENFEQFKPQLQLGARALESAINDQVMLQDARRVGVPATTDDEIAEVILEDPSLRDESGRFVGTDRYVSIIRRSGYRGGVEAFENDVANRIMISKWSSIVSEPVDVNDRELREVHRQRTEKTAIDYVLVASADQEIETKVDDGDLRAWYDSHQEDYRRPDGRKIRFVTVSREEQLASVEVTEEEILASYQSNQNNYTHPEQREARHILFRVAPDADEATRQNVRAGAEAVLARIQEGEDFATLAQEYSEDPGSGTRGGDLGYFGRGAMVPAFDAAAFETPVGEMAPIVETDFGFHILEVTGEREAGVEPLDKVREDIRRSLRLRAAQDRVVTEAQRIRTAIASASDLGAVAASENLAVQERFVTEGESLADIGASPEFTSALFALEQGGVSEPLRVNSGLAIAVVDELVPASVAPFDEVADRVRADVINDRSLTAAIESAEKVLKRRKDLESVAKALKVEVRSSGDLAPGQTLPEAGGADEAFDELMFGDTIAVGDTGVIPVPSGAVIYTVTNRVAFDETAFQESRETLRAELLDQRRNSLVSAVIEQLREEFVIERNQSLVSRITG